MAISKCLISFRNRMSHFNADLDFVDILSKSIENGNFSSEEELFPGSNDERYTILSHYKVGDQNRRLVVNHLKSTLYTAYIKDLYEEFSIYLKGIMKEVYSNAKVTPERLSGEHTVNLSSVDILHHLQAGDLADVVIDDIFQSLENERSTIALVTKFHKKLGINIDQTLVDNAIYYLEIRHKLVHTDGYVSDEFKKTHDLLNYTSTNKIKLDYYTICQAYAAILHLVSDIDSKVMNAGLAKSHIYKKETA
ncbi:MAG: hypothetical protein J1F42_13470 [Lachnospiraceae bacterium]|nr:hypothetical protein [Lachnospiraceae bacterium]